MAAQNMLHMCEGNNFFLNYLKYEAAECKQINYLNRCNHVIQSAREHRILSHQLIKMPC